MPLTSIFIWARRVSGAATALSSARCSPPSANGFSYLIVDFEDYAFGAILTMGLLVLAFDDFVADYRFAGTKHHGSPFVSYIILAEMVKAGWRLAAEPLKDDGKRDDAEESDAV